MNPPKNVNNKRKEAIQPVVVHDDDDGFVDPPEHQIKHKPNIKTLAGPGQPKFVPYSDKKLKARVGVINLKNSVTGLSKQQRKAIKSMGFRPFLSLDIDTIPRRFAQWLVSNYDCDRNELNAGHHYIHVMSQTVKDVLGVPFGRLPVNEKNKPRMGSLDTLRICKSQYLGKSRITVKDVLEQMKNLWMDLLVQIDQNIGDFEKLGNNINDLLTSGLNEYPNNKEFLIRKNDWEQILGVISKVASGLVVDNT
ncbi:hypothetical protein E3N88_25936 [Mikania micrantha]|uniref:Uncharacterized protein n=1 Tax=Mikania micrantha TaxID=192012 RepID=A0A5N6N6N9_9ASTR|nr:hypothetical protein E3N88_25936 [Mikania micrantha]